MRGAISPGIHSFQEKKNRQHRNLEKLLIELKNRGKACTLRHSTLWPKKAHFRSGRGYTGAVKGHVSFFLPGVHMRESHKEPLVPYPKGINLELSSCFFSKPPAYVYPLFFAMPIVRLPDACRVLPWGL